jgi:hypothetical protein
MMYLNVVVVVGLRCTPFDETVCEIQVVVGIIARVRAERAE